MKIRIKSKQELVKDGYIEESDGGLSKEGNAFKFFGSWLDLLNKTFEATYEGGVDPRFIVNWNNSKFYISAGWVKIL